MLESSNPDKASTSNEKSVPDRKFPLFQFKTDGKSIEVTFGPSLVGIFIAVATAKLAFVTTALTLLSGSGVLLIGWAVMRRLR